MKKAMVFSLITAMMLFVTACGQSASDTVSVSVDAGGARTGLAVSERERKDQSQPEESREAVITLSFTGDCTLGTDANFNRSTSLPAYYDANGPKYFMENVRDIFEADDLTVVNMEGTLTESSTRAAKKFAFKGDPSYTQILSSSSVEAANLANNHSHDYGEASYTDTIEALEGADIRTFGYDETVIKDVKGVKVGLTGIYELADHLGREEQVKTNIQQLRDQGAEIVVCSFHWGIEREARPNSTQVTLAHLAIDSGADLVIGHHPHVLQGIEKYHGKTIAYSLGNFCFGGNSNPGDKDTMILQQTFTVIDGVVEKESLKTIPCSLSSVSSHNDYRPTPAEGTEAERIAEKIRTRSEGLSTEPDEL